MGGPRRCLPGCDTVSLLLKRWAKLYSQPTDAERAIEPAIASLGVPYRFNHPLWALAVFPDFILIRNKLVIEVDDPSHARPAKRKADAERTKKLNGAGWQVVRCTNDEALADPYGTVDRLMALAGLDLRTRKD